MLAPNHIAGGLVFTGIFAALGGENIMQTKTNLVCVLICSLLPDIDLPQSPAGFCVKPLSRWILKKYGHRTITHSVWALGLVVWIAKMTGLSMLVCGLAFFSHLLFDAMTYMGIIAFYPFSHRKIVLPANPEYRLKVNDYKSEAMVFGVFVGLSVFTYPLMKDGFWTTFNRSFGMPKTLYSEFIKSQDLLNVHYVIQTGSITNSGQGYLIACEREDYFHLWRNDTFIDIDAQKTIIKSVVPEHSHRRYWFSEKRFIGISADSLNALLRGQIICDLQIDANEQFQVWVNGIPDQKTSTIIKYPHSVFIRSLDSLPKRDSLFEETDFESQRIQNELTTLQNEHLFKQSEYARHVDSLQLYDNLARNETNAILKEKYQKRRDEIRLPDKPIKDWVREKSLQTSLSIARNKFQKDQEKRLFEREKAYQNKLQTKKQTLFVGIVKTVKIE